MKSSFVSLPSHAFALGKGEESAQHPFRDYSWTNISMEARVLRLSEGLLLASEGGRKGVSAFPTEQVAPPASKRASHSPSVTFCVYVVTSEWDKAVSDIQKAAAIDKIGIANYRKAKTYL